MWGVSHNDALGDPAAGFHTTRWTMVLACGEADTSEGQQALADLFRTYWYPLYAYVRRSGYSEADAEDLVQGFCVYLQEKHAIAKAPVPLFFADVVKEFSQPRTRPRAS
jgi:hypothetical protein